MPESNINKILIIAGVMIAVLVGAFFIWWNTKFEISNDFPTASSGFLGLQKEISNLSGLECPNRSKRPVAVMMAGDLIAQPLSGIGEADLVFEMPVAPNGITRMMAVFQCKSPTEIGSIRSARNEFIPLAAGVGAILAHWGGEREALVRLDGGIIDNGDALKYEGTVFYRKKGVKAPHNGFANLLSIIEKSENLGYDLQNEFTGYIHSDKNRRERSLSNIVSEINLYRPPFNVKWVYNKDTNTYARTRKNIPEIDRLSGKPIEARTIIVLETKSRVINELYISVDVAGEGVAKIYQNGILMTGRWQKNSKDLTGKLYFYDGDGREIEFLPGKKWIEITTEN